MATLYMMRHGQTLFNVLKRKQGWCDSPLTELGIEQAHRAGALLHERGVTFDHFYTSTSERAVDTLEVVMGELGVAGAPYERVKGLKEWNFGAFEAITEDVNPPLPYGDYYKPFGGEGEMELRERLMTTIAELMNRPGHDCVLMASHGAAVAQVLRATGEEELIRPNVTPRPRIGNCGIIVYDWNGERLHPLELINPNA